MTPLRGAGSSAADVGVWARRLADDLVDLETAGLHRRRQIVQPIDSTHVEIAGRRFVNFASNNYLGLTHHPVVLQAARNAMESCGFGSGAAALISGYAPAHASAEAALARWKRTESAVLLPSGYQANCAAVQTFAAVGRRQGGVRFLIDKLSHASLIDAVRGTGAPFRVFPHNHLDKVERLLADAPADQAQVVVTESIFSMDGDEAELSGLAALRRRFGFALLLDEAHASGLYGSSGEGLVGERGVRDDVDVSVVTLSKALGCIGGAVCAPTSFCDALVNHGRAFIFSTSMPASAAAAAEAAIGVIEREPARRQRVRLLAKRVREALSMPGDSPIIPVILGEASAALAAAQRLGSEGLFVGAVRPPSVPRGSSRLRITLCCDHTDEEVSKLIESLSALR